MPKPAKPRIVALCNSKCFKPKRHSTEARECFDLHSTQHDLEHGGSSGTTTYDRDPVSGLFTCVVCGASESSLRAFQTHIHTCPLPSPPPRSPEPSANRNMTPEVVSAEDLPSDSRVEQSALVPRESSLCLLGLG